MQGDIVVAMTNVHWGRLTRLTPEIMLETTDCAESPTITPLTPPTVSRGCMLIPRTAQIKTETCKLWRGVSPLVLTADVHVSCRPQTYDLCTHS